MTTRILSAARRPALGFWLVLASFYVYFIAKNYRFQLDDALIYLRYIQNALDGHGLVYNTGIRFNGLTSPLFSYLVLALAWTTGSAPLASFLISSACLFLAAIVMARLFEEAMAESGIASAQLAAWFGAVLLLFLPYFYLTFGMETGLYTLLSAALITLMRKRVYRWAGICAALLFLTRSEGAFLILAVALVDVVKWRRLPPFSIPTYVVPLAMVAGVFALNYAYYGAALPQTGMAKIWQGRSGLWGEHFAYLDVGYLYGWIFDSNPLVVATYAVFIGMGLVVLRDRFLIGAVALYLSLYAAFYIALNIPNYHWYYSPFFAFAPFFAAAGVVATLTALRRFEQGPRGVLLAALACVPLAALLVSDFRTNSVARTGVESYRQIGEWMKGHLPPDASIAMVEIGTVGYYSQRNIVDILGLVNPDNAKYIGERRLDAWLQEYKVDYLLVHEPLWPHELSLLGAGLIRKVTEDCRFQFSGYRLFELSGDEAAGVRACEPMQSYAVSADSADRAAIAVDPGADRGHLDTVDVVGNFVRIRGWARTEQDAPYEALRYRGSSNGRTIWRRDARADVAAHFGAATLAQSGFSGAIRFDTHEQAESALADGCVVVSGPSAESVAALALTAGHTCR